MARKNIPGMHYPSGRLPAEEGAEIVRGERNCESCRYLDIERWGRDESGNYPDFVHWCNHPLESVRKRQETHGRNCWGFRPKRMECAS